MQALAEYELFRKMMDKVIGPDEELNEQKPLKRNRSAKGKKPGKHKGGEIVQIDDF